MNEDDPSTTESPASTADDCSSNTEIQDENGVSEPFSWPPVEVKLEESSSAIGREVRTPSKAARTSPALNLLRSLESSWLSPTALPLAQRARKARWQPDSCDVYCDRCGMSIGPYEGDEFGCSQCRDDRLVWERFVRLGEYDGSLSQWIKDAKFHGQRRLAQDMGRLLGQSARLAGAPTGRLAVVPVGMSPMRRLARGYDQSAEIARGVAQELSCPLVHAFRRKHRPSQRAVPITQRKKNISGSFSLRPGVDFNGWSVLIVDDVRTTGSTLTQACKTITTQNKSKSVDIWVAVVAVTPAHDRRPAESRGGQMDELEPVSGGRSGEVGGSKVSPLDSPVGVGTVPIPFDE
jgi:ComF family protein